MSCPATELLELLEQDQVGSYPWGDFPAIYIDQGAAVGGTVTLGELGDYMDEVQRAVTAISIDVDADPNKLDQSLRYAWSEFLFGRDDSYELSPKAVGWVWFYTSERSLWSRLGEVSELWQATNAFEARLQILYDQILASGVSMTVAKPKLGFDTPTAAESLTDVLTTAVGIATVVGLLWGVGQIVSKRR